MDFNLPKGNITSNKTVVTTNTDINPEPTSVFTQCNKKEKCGRVYLFYGDTAAGKTYASLTFPEPIYFIDTEDRAKNTIESQFPNKKILVTKPMDARSIMLKNLDVFDEHKSIENITTAILELVKMAEEGSLKNGTIVLESCTDLWSWIQRWMEVELSKTFTGKGMTKADIVMMKVNNQLDWKIANRRHYDIINSLKVLTTPKYGANNIVITAREDQVPSYVANDSSVKDKIRCHKDLPFFADVTFHLKKIYKDGVESHVAICEKLAGYPAGQVINDITYEKIEMLIDGFQQIKK